MYKHYIHIAPIAQSNSYKCYSKHGSNSYVNRCNMAVKDNDRIMTQW